MEIPAIERDRLLELARVAVAVAAGARPPAALEGSIASGPLPDRRAAAFVTLTRDGDLRGCTGTLDADSRGWRSVVDAAATAARSDPRFEPVGPSELPSLEIEVSILGPLVRLADPLAFRLGTDGIVVRRGARRGLFLPEVAGMLGNDRVRMLDACCRKAGLPGGAWRDPGTEVWAFRTHRFGGPALA